MIDNCPNCKGKEVEKISDDEIYCAKCDQTFKVTKGKAQPASGGRLKKLEEAQTRNAEEISKVKQSLYGKDEDIF